MSFMEEIEQSESENLDLDLPEYRSFGAESDEEIRFSNMRTEEQRYFPEYIAAQEESLGGAERWNVKTEEYKAEVTISENYNSEAELSYMLENAFEALID